MIEGISLISAPSVWVKPTEDERKQAIAQFTTDSDDGSVFDQDEYESDNFETLF